MALPSEYRTERLVALQAAVLRAMQGNPFETLDRLSDDDVFVIGVYIHVYNSIEFQLRRILRVTAHYLNPGQQRKKTQASELCDVVRVALNGLIQNEERRTKANEMLDEIKLRQPFRNLLAHFVARRIPGEDAIVLMSMDDQDAKRMGFPDIGHDELQYIVLDMPDLRGLTTHIQKYEEILRDEADKVHYELANR